MRKLRGTRRSCRGASRTGSSHWGWDEGHLLQGRGSERGRGRGKRGKRGERRRGTDL